MTLERELEIVDDYLALESLRFGERLRIERDIEPGALGVRIPVMLLQTVVENAIKHGIAELPGGGVLRVCAAMRDGWSSIDVRKSAACRRHTSRAMATASGCTMPPSVCDCCSVRGASFELDLSRADLATARICVPGTS